MPIFGKKGSHGSRNSLFDARITRQVVDDAKRKVGLKEKKAEKLKLSQNDSLQTNSPAVFSSPLFPAPTPGAHELSESTTELRVTFATQPSGMPMAPQGIFDPFEDPQTSMEQFLSYSFSSHHDMFPKSDDVDFTTLFSGDVLGVSSLPSLAYDDKGLSDLGSPNHSDIFSNKADTPQSSTVLGSDLFKMSVQQGLSHKIRPDISSIGDLLPDDFRAVLLASPQGNVYLVSNKFASGSFGKALVGYAIRRGGDIDEQRDGVVLKKLRTIEHSQKNSYLASLIGLSEQPPPNEMLHIGASLKVRTRVSLQQEIDKEIELIRSLGGPVQVIDHFSHLGDHYLVMTPMDTTGKTAPHVVAKSKRNDLRQAFNREMAVALAQHLAEIHEKNYVHRDIRTENILVVGSQGVLSAAIADFGLAADMTAPYTTGPGSYPPPELIEYLLERSKAFALLRKGMSATQIRAQMTGPCLENGFPVVVENTPQGDIWSFGATLLEIVCADAEQHNPLIYRPNNRGGVDKPATADMLRKFQAFRNLVLRGENHTGQQQVIDVFSLYSADLGGNELASFYKYVGNAYLNDPAMTNFIIVHLLNPNAEERPTARQITSFLNGAHKTSPEMKKELHDLIKTADKKVANLRMNLYIVHEFLKQIDPDFFVA